MSTPHRRLVLALAHAGKTDIETARAAGRDRGWFSAVKRGKFSAGDHWPAIADFLGVKVEWLRDGDDAKGPPWWVSDTDEHAAVSTLPDAPMTRSEAAAIRSDLAAVKAALVAIAPVAGLAEKPRKHPVLKLSPKPLAHKAT